VGAGRAFAQLEDGARTWDGAAAAGGDASRLEGIGFTHIWWVGGHFGEHLQPHLIS